MNEKKKKTKGTAANFYVSLYFPRQMAYLYYFTKDNIKFLRYNK